MMTGRFDGSVITVANKREVRRDDKNDEVFLFINAKS